MIEFGDRVRIKEAPETSALGIAALEGDIYGFTTPSVTSVTVVGGAPDDLAYVVSVPGREDMWIRPDLIEKIHHNEGMTLEAGTSRLVRQPDGSWLETGSSPSGFLQRLKRMLGLG